MTPFNIPLYIPRAYRHALILVFPPSAFQHPHHIEILYVPSCYPLRFRTLVLLAIRLHPICCPFATIPSHNHLKLSLPTRVQAISFFIAIAITLPLVTTALLRWQNLLLTSIMASDKSNPESVLLSDIGRAAF
ncbi:hypothetical protein PCH_Pc13g11290 [Penicillium rubens Wisconsin 54-1255]|uniref:Uncharacterized protein n=1 Tax=Penicillium rubens (strain ATCC 28089 / DSM 1075 / NRRL 1951 / Wisconsin 54-1255) TaxID=500485 RepID=B6H4W7_PENRW|nr:hypothetical protein PCH_Pc13g11290 [Penicillium rubens Wisconsin 54-1255]